jgi:hypothetical protein
MAPSATSPVPVDNGNLPNKAADIKAQKKYDKSITLLKTRIPYMGQLNSLIAISLDSSKPDIFVDTRGTPRFLEDSTEKSACRVSLRPDVLIELVEGKVEPRFALFKDAIFDETKMPQGEIPVAIKFGDLLTPNNPTNPLKVSELNLSDSNKLPEPTEDLEQVRADMRKWGYGLVKNALSPAEIEKMQRAVREQGEGEAAAGVGNYDGGAGSPNQRIWTLINKGQEFLDLLEHPLIDEIVPDFLGDGALLHSYSANIVRPGNTPMQLHTDQIAIQPPVRSLAFGLNIMWFLSDVTRENGGTRVFPGSHLGPVAPSDLFDIDGTVAAAGPAGTALVFESRLWHCTGPNEKKTGERPVILMFFMRQFVRQQENNFLSIRPEVERGLTDKVREYLGYRTTGALGGVEGKVLAGTWAAKVENPVGPYRAGGKA